MTADEIIEGATRDGLTLTLQGDALAVAGSAAVRALWRFELATQKSEIVDYLKAQALTEKLSAAPEPPQDPNAWRELAQAYHLHHFVCPTCIAAGQGRGLRCGTGAALWTTYQSTVN